MIEILWISPNLNHYKINFLNRLADNDQLTLSVLAGEQPTELGHRQGEKLETFNRIDVNAKKSSFHISPSVYIAILRLLVYKKFDIVLMPIEKKLFLLIFFLFFLKFIFRFKLVSYNHASTRGLSGHLRLDMMVTRFLFTLYNRVIFYTNTAREWAVDSDLLPAKKAYYANNTLNTDEIWKYYKFTLNHSAQKAILFIGRLIPNKNLGLLSAYYKELQKSLPDLKLLIIGDGPEAPLVQELVDNHDLVSWYGAVVNEEQIADIMRLVHLVFIPGWSGLSIVHAFCYGKPYVTINGSHPPEFDYLEDGVNGLVLGGDVEKDCQRIVELLNDPAVYEKACRAAYEKAQELSIANWCQKMETAFAA